MCYVASRVQLLVITLFDLLLLFITVYVVSKFLNDILYVMFQNERINMNLTRII
jgi:hypothetical protein